MTRKNYAVCKKQHVGNIQFIGNAKLDNYYKKAEILCMTSSFEGFGLVLTEALQNGIIPIALIVTMLYAI